MNQVPDLACLWGCCPHLATYCWLRHSEMTILPLLHLLGSRGIHNAQGHFPGWPIGQAGR